MLQLQLNNRQYKAFIKYAVLTCDSFSLVFKKHDTQVTAYWYQEIYEQIRSFVIKKQSIGIHPDTGTHFDHSELIYVSCNKQSGSVLLALSNLFDWNGNTSPSELCFYRKGKMWFSLINHESQAVIADTTDNDLRFLADTHIYYWHTT